MSSGDKKHLLIGLAKEPATRNRRCKDTQWANRSNRANMGVLARGAWWLNGRFAAFRPMGLGYKSRSSCHVETLNKSFTRSCFGVKLRQTVSVLCRERFWVVKGPGDWERRYRYSLNEWTESYQKIDGLRDGQSVQGRPIILWCMWKRYESKQYGKIDVDASNQASKATKNRLQGERVARAD